MSGLPNTVLRNLPTCIFDQGTLGTLGARDFYARFPVSVKSLFRSRAKNFSRAFAARGFGLRPKKYSRRAREKTSGTQGTDQEDEIEHWMTSKEISNKLDVFQTKYLLCMEHQEDLRHLLAN